MLGKQHLTLSVMTAAVLLTPLMQSHPIHVIISFIGVAVGSLIPDIDAKDAAVFHTNIRGLNSRPGVAFNSFVAPVLPLFGYFTKYIIYKPVVHLLNLLTAYTFEIKHRHFTHSVIGILTLTSATGIYLLILNLFVKIELIWIILFLASYLSGAIMHLIQDSCTKSGIKWNQPFSNTKIKGGLNTGKDNFKPLLMLYLLSGLTLLTAYSTLTNSTVDALKGSSMLVILAWATFMLISDVRIQK